MRLRLELELFLDPESLDLGLAGPGGVPVGDMKSGSSGSKLPKMVNSSSSASDSQVSPTKNLTDISEKNQCFKSRLFLRKSRTGRIC